MLLLAIAFEEYRIWSLKDDLKTERELHDTCKINLTTATNNTVVLKSAVLRCNNAVDDLEKQGRERDALLRSQATQNIEAREELKRRAGQVETTPETMNSWYRVLYGVKDAR